MSNANIADLPAILSGTAFRPREVNLASGKTLKAFDLAVYAGKNQDGTYRKGPTVDVVLVGEAAKAALPTEKDRVRVSGFLETKTRTGKDGATIQGLTLTALAFTVEPRAAQPAATQPAANAAAPSGVRASDIPPDYDPNDCPF